MSDTDVMKELVQKATAGQCNKTGWYRFKYDGQTAYGRNFSVGTKSICDLYNEKSYK